MNITVKLFASFRVGRFAAASRQVPPGTRIRDVVAGLGIEAKDVGIILVNGRHGGADQILRDDDRLSLFPLLGGG